MEMGTATLRGNSVNDYGKIFTHLAFILICVRSNAVVFFGETIYFTIVINALLVIASIFERFDKFTFLYLVCLCAIIILNPGTLAIIDIVITVYLLRRESIGYLIKVNAIVLICYLIVYSIGLYTGDIHDVVRVTKKGVLHTMGYVNANGFGYLGFQIICSLFLLFWKKKSMTLLLFALIPFINEFFYGYSLSRTPWISGYVVMIFILLCNLRLITKKARYIVGLLPFLFFVTFIYMAINFRNYPELNLTLSGRLSENGLAIQQMHLYNWIVGMKRPEELVLDGSYPSFLFNGGLFSVFYFFSSFYRNIIKKWKILYPFLPYIIGLLAGGVAENMIASASPLSIIFWFLIFDYKGKTAHLIKGSNKKHHSICE